MLQPRTLLDHADRLLEAAVDEADVRRATSAYYYAVFHLLTVHAARIVARDNAVLAALLRRTIQHRDLRKVCDALTVAGSSTRSAMETMLGASLKSQYVNIARAFATLQVARHAADYDLDQTPSLASAQAWRELCHDAFDDWEDVCDQPGTAVFLTALLLADRWSRRG